MIDWGVARSVGRSIAGDDGAGASVPGDLAGLATRGAERITAYTGMVPVAPLPVPEIVGREAWLDANLDAMRAMLDPATERLGTGMGPLGGAVRAAGGLLIGAEIGALGGYLGRRVLGQYDVHLLDRSVAPRLLFVAPNLASAAGELEADPAQLVSWVCLHEVTHAVQFGAVTWLQDHLAGMVSELLEGLDVELDASSLLRLPSRADLRALADAVREGSLVRLAGGEQRAALLERMQATMAMIEGHAEHVMDAVGADVLDDLAGLRDALDRRRRDRAPLLAWIERLLGLDLKLRQYELGKAFCDAVVAEAGVGALHRAWSAPELLPTLAELADPPSWIARTDVPPVTNSVA